MKWTYKNAGVDLAGATAWVDTVRRHASLIEDEAVVGSLGGFAGLYRMANGSLLAACTDGVGTKIEVARLAQDYRFIGQDLVAMNVNDLVTCGARPLFFLDYIACGSLDRKRLEPVLEGIVGACRESGCALLGGETAEMPDVYGPDAIDLAGFAVGTVSEEELLAAGKVRPGDRVVGLRSSGIHSNGFSLVRKILLEGEEMQKLSQTVPELGEKLATTLLRPTRIYVRQALHLKSSIPVSAMAHITGGGLVENISRILPHGLSCRIDFQSWKRPAIFAYIAEKGVSESEMRRVFNLGIGYVFIIPEKDAGPACRILEGMGEEPELIGIIEK